ncbi:membrane protein [Kitasatospora phosalacinea]|uniref:Membrane protein n=1 Tax=Kitasatospora phosalacinea TaxID=2065 RepID=A0A9W6V3V5_9ACTN|nr:MHYT domain-containing protein [Kitasatospora phosalacinea]GLW74809.1 membrane protein [Kitasatospora phosalacinea]
MNHDTTAHLDGFQYGWVNPVVAYLIACVGAAIGLRCTARAMTLRPNRRSGWLALAAGAFGCGIWSMHFIAMLGFTVDSSGLVYDVPLTLLSLLVAVVVVGLGIGIVGYRGKSTGTLLVSGVLTGCGVAVMHYLGMAAMQVEGAVSYDTPLVVASVAIAVAAATAALWMTLNVKGLAAALGAALIAGVAVVAMHYTAMAAVTVTLDGRPLGGGTPASQFALPLAVGIMVVLAVAGIAIALSPQDPESGEGPAVEPIRVDLFGQERY